MSLRTRFCFLMLGVPAAVPGLAAVQQAAPPPVAIEHVTVIPMTGQVALRDHTVIVREGIVVTVGPATSVAVPAGALRVDGRGKFLTPGLTDAHVHVFDPDDLVLLLAHGVTSALTMSGAPLHLAWRRAINAGALVGPTLYTTGPQLKVEAQPAVDFERAVSSPEDAVRQVQIADQLGYDFLKVWGPLAADVSQPGERRAGARPSPHRAHPA